MPAERALCIDTDALVSLLALDCFDAALKCIDVKRTECFRLRAAKRQIERSSWVVERWPFFDRRRSLEVVDELRMLPETPSVQLLEALNINGVDEGEGYFLATLAENPSYLLLSGDRRMLEALHGSMEPRVVTIRESVRGRVILFTQIIAALAMDISVPVMEDKVRATLCRHSTLRVMFGSRPTRPDDFWEAYRSELRNIEGICGKGWLFPLPPDARGSRRGV